MLCREEESGTGGEEKPTADEPMEQEQGEGGEGGEGGAEGGEQHSHNLVTLVKWRF